MHDTLRLLSVLIVASALSAQDVEPGLHRQLTCPGDATESYDLYLPKAYAEKRMALFPVLFVSDGGGNPTFHGLESWAERQEVIMVTIINSRNGPWEPIHKAQKAVTGAVFSQYRVHPCLRFSAGLSGAGWASWILASKFGDDWGGVVTCGAGPVTLNLTNTKVLVYYFVGTEDNIYTFARAKDDFQKDKAAGFTMRWLQRDGGGHIWANTEELSLMLDWMLGYQRVAHPRLPPTERKDQLALLTQRAKAVIALEDVALRRKGCEEILTIDPVRLAPDLKPLRDTWLACILALSQSVTDPVLAARDLESALQSPYGEGTSDSIRKELTVRLGALRKDPAVKLDSDSRAALAQVKAAEKKAGTNRNTLKQVAESYAAIAKRWPETDAGREAKELARKLAAGP